MYQIRQEFDENEDNKPFIYNMTNQLNGKESFLKMDIQIHMFLEDTKTLIQEYGFVPWPDASRRDPFASSEDLFPNSNESRIIEEQEPQFKLSLTQFNKLLSFISCPVCSSRNVTKDVITNNSVLSMGMTCRCGNFYWDSTLTSTEDGQISPTATIEVNPNQNVELAKEIKEEPLDESFEAQDNVDLPSTSSADQETVNNQLWKAEYLATKSGKNGVFVYRLQESSDQCYVFQLRKPLNWGVSAWACTACKYKSKSKNVEAEMEEEESEPALGWKWPSIRMKDCYFLDNPEKLYHTCQPKNYIEEVSQRLRYLIYQEIGSAGRKNKEQTAMALYKEKVEEVLDGLTLNLYERFELQRLLIEDSNAKRMVNKRLNSSKTDEMEEDGGSPQKKRAFDLTYKLAVIEFATRESNLAASNHFKVHRKQISQWLEQKDQIIEQLQQKSKSKRLQGGGRPPKYLEIEKNLRQWVDDQTSMNIKVSRSMVRAKAVQFGNDFPEFKASNGWLEKFLKRLKEAPPADEPNQTDKIFSFLEEDFLENGKDSMGFA